MWPHARRDGSDGYPERDVRRQLVHSLAAQGALGRVMGHSVHSLTRALKGHLRSVWTLTMALRMEASHELGSAAPTMWTRQDPACVRSLGPCDSPERWWILEHQFWRRATQGSPRESCSLPKNSRRWNSQIAESPCGQPGARVQKRGKASVPTRERALLLRPKSSVCPHWVLYPACEAGSPLRSKGSQRGLGYNIRRMEYRLTLA